ncbi:Excisionase [Kerstersia similis]
MQEKMNWVRLDKYCELSGDTKHAVYFRRKTGIWKEGIHSKLDPQNRIWVNTEEVEKWVHLSQPQNSRQASAYAR